MKSQYFRIRVEDKNGSPHVEARTPLNNFQPGDTVYWDFDQSLLEGDQYVPTILTPKTQFSRLSHRGSRVTMEGFENFFDPCAPREPLRFTYHAALVPRGETWRAKDVKQSNQGKLVLKPAHNPGDFVAGRRIRVTLRAELRGRPGEKTVPLPMTLALHPPNLSIQPGDTAIFDFDITPDFFGPDQGWIPEVVFPGDQPVLGPFAETATFLEAPAQVVLSGDSGQRGSFGYLVRIRTVDGLMALSSEDPAIDNDGDLIGPIDPAIHLG